MGEYHSSHHAHGVLLVLGAGGNTIWKAQRPFEDLELKSFSIHSLLWIMRSDAACGYLCMSSSHICEGSLICRTTGGKRIRALVPRDRRGACFSITHTWNCHWLDEMKMNFFVKWCSYLSSGSVEGDEPSQLPQDCPTFNMKPPISQNTHVQVMENLVIVISRGV